MLFRSVKSLLLSKFTHLFTSLPKPSLQWIQQLKKTLYKFIWGNKIEKISRKTLTLDFENGGLRMTNIETFIKSLKLTWFRRLFITNSSWINIFSEVTGCSITKLTQFGPSYCKQRANSTHNSFWKEALYYFAEFLESFEMKDSYILLEPLWYNDKIKIENKCTYFKALHEKGFHRVCDLLDIQGNFITYHSIKNNYAIQIPFTTYEGLKQAIINSWPNIKHILRNVTFQPYQPEFIEVLCKYKYL